MYNTRCKLLILVVTDGFKVGAMISVNREFITKGNNKHEQEINETREPLYQLVIFIRLIHMKYRIFFTCKRLSPSLFTESSADFHFLKTFKSFYRLNDMKMKMKFHIRVY